MAFQIKVDTDMHESFFELEEVERNVDSLERAMESTKQWHVQDRTHLKQMLEALRVTEKTFHEERDDGSFRTARFMGKVGNTRKWTITTSISKILTLVYVKAGKM